MSPRVEISSDTIPINVPIVFVIILYIGNTFCFVFTTCTTVLYFNFRNEPAVKATATSLNILIYIGCYIWLFYLFLINSTLLGRYHLLSTTTRNLVCLSILWINGLGYPVALIMSTVLVKLIRIYLYSISDSKSMLAQAETLRSLCTPCFSHHLTH